jgi:hypothetical protein
MIPTNDDELDRRTIDLVTSALPVPERDEAYGREVWTRLQPALAESRSRRRSRWLAWSPWAAAAAVAILVTGAFFLGRATSRPPDAPVSVEARRRILLAAVGDHLEKSRRTLIEYVNAGPEADARRQRAVAEDLLAGSRLYRQTAARSGEPGVADVLEEVERVLLEIANGPEQPTSETRAALARRLDTEGILFKIEIIGAHATERADVPAPRSAGVRS